jgi:hypothetical protein
VTETKSKSAPYMGLVNQAWAHRFPGSKPPVYAVRALRPVYQALGDVEATDRLVRYLSATEGRFVNLHRFATTHAEWATKKPTDTKHYWSDEDFRARYGG